MNKRIIYRFIGYAMLVWAMFSVSACTEGETVVADTAHGADIEFRITLPGNPVLRTASDVEVATKTAFSDGDVIQVSAVFTMKAGGTKAYYDCFKYVSGNWVSATVDEAKQMYWPLDAATGKFTVYFIPGTTGAITETLTKALGGDYTVSDPLFGESDEVVYGHAVRIQFKHLTTRLIVLKTVNTAINEFWLRKTDGAFHNAYSLTLNADNTLSFGFCATGDNGGSVAATKDVNGYVTYHLEPGNYNGAQINYIGNQPYLTLNVDQLNGLEAGQSHVLDITKTLGVIEDPEVVDPWEPDEPVGGGSFDLDKFLSAISNNQTYILDDGTEIIIRNIGGELVLMTSVDFEGKEFTPISLANNITFHGDDHYLKNLKGPLFSEMRGKVDNLALENVDIDNPSLSVVGALAESCSGTAENILLKNVNIKLYARERSDVTCGAGALAGLVTGHVNGVTLSENITVTAGNADGLAEADATVIVGGVAGQVIGSLSGVVKKESETVVKVVNTTKGEGSLFVGGVVGYLTGNGAVNDCTVSVDVDVSSSMAISNYLGGVIGNQGGNVSFCNVTGEIYGGCCRTYSHSGVVLLGCAFTGGVSGFVGEQAVLSDCNTAVMEPFVALQNWNNNTEH